MKLCPQCTTGYPDRATVCPTHGGVLSELRELKPGMVIHKTYRIVRKLGQGGMGTVYLADQIYMHKPRALKFLSSELSSDASFTERFRHEVQTLHEIRHPNVVDCGDLEPAEDDSLFFSMEFVDGPDLRELLDRSPEPFDVHLALSITRGIANGLAAAHARGMVHRDIKPENILLTQSGDQWLPKIADFGIVATKEGSTARSLTKTGRTLLTLAYAAPEQWRGARAADLDGRTDLYALGCVLFEMLTHQTVFNGETYEEWGELHKNIAPQRPSSLRPELVNWRGLDALVLKLLAKDRTQRPNDISELLALLDQVKYVAPKVPKPQRPRTYPAWHLLRGPGQPSRLGNWLIALSIGLLATAGLVVFAAYQAGLSAQPSSAADLVAHGYKLLAAGKPSEAAPLFQKACDEDNRFACNELGWLYHEGNGLTRSVLKAKDLFYKSCQLGHGEGCSNLGGVYWRREILPWDAHYGINMLQRACTMGNDSGCLLLVRTDVFNWPGTPWNTENDYWEHELQPVLNVGCSSNSQEACRLLRCRASSVPWGWCYLSPSSRPGKPGSAPKRESSNEPNPPKHPY